MGFHPRRALRALFEDDPQPAASLRDFDGNEHIEDIREQLGAVPGMLGPDAGVLLYLLAYAAPEGDIVEIGSWQGQSTVFLAKACKDARKGVVHAIDTFKGNPGKEHLYAVEGGIEIYEAFKRNIADNGLSDFVVAHTKRSLDARGEISRPLRMLFIDG